jgi:hypothetical protein
VTDEVRALLSLSDDAFFALDTPATTRLQSQVAERLLPPPLSQRPGAAPLALPELRVLAAPQRVEWPARSGLPFLLAEVRSRGREWAVSSRQNRRILVSNLSTGVVAVATMVDPGRKRAPQAPSGTGPRPEGAAAVASSIGVFRHDLLKWFTPPQLQGRLALTGIDHELQSNTVAVEVNGAHGPAPAGPQRRVLPAEALKQGMPGVSAQWPAAVAAGAPAIARFEVRLPRRSVALVEAFGGAAQALAATLVLTRLDTPSARLLHLAIPLGASAPADEVATAFSLDLGVWARSGLAPGEWLAWLVVGDAVVGPHPLQLAPS